MKRIYHLSLLPALIASIVFLMSCGNADAQHNSQPNTQSVKAGKNEHHWNYKNIEWVKEGFPDCGGMQQSPINIIKNNAVKDTTLTALTFSYAASTSLNELDNGHTLQLANTDANSVTVNGSSYNLLQLHFHAGSEHQIDGKQFPMEIHFVHKNSSTNKIIVIGVMVSEGAANLEVSKIFESWPFVADSTFKINKTISLDSLLPTSKEYYTYPGSLTTPPCTEGLQWFVLKHSITMSHSQIQYFKKHYNEDFRPVQALNGRIVKTK
jgi:carbonic anhydrase